MIIQSAISFLQLQQTTNNNPSANRTDDDKEDERTNDYSNEEEKTKTKKKKKIVPSLGSSSQLKRTSASISHSSSLSSVIDLLNQSQGQVWKYNTFLSVIISYFCKIGVK